MKYLYAVIAIVSISVISLFFFWIPNADPGRIPQAYAVLINNDPAKRHRENMETAIQALKTFDCFEIAASGEKSNIPTLDQVRQVFQQIRECGGRLELLYITGHGTRIYNREHPEGLPGVMLKDQPLTPLHLAPVIGKGPTVVYLDQCFAPAFIEHMHQKLQGNFLLLSDKHEEHPTASCRGISTEFWKEFQIQGEQGETMFQAAFYAWKKHCNDGICKVLKSKQEADCWEKLQSLKSIEYEHTPHP